MESLNIIKGPPELEPVPEYSLGKFLFEKLQSYGNNVAQIHAVTGEKRTFLDILKRSISVAECLKSKGIGIGDTISICSENSLDFCLPVLAALYIGAICAPLNQAYTERELNHAMNISKPKLVFCSETTVNKIDKVAQKTNFVKYIVVFGNHQLHRYIPFSFFLGSDFSYFLPTEVNPKITVASIMCSSGTTGLCKGVMLTHYNILYSVNHQKDRRYGSLSQNDTILALLPFFHAYAFVLQIATLCNGTKVVVMPKFEEKLFLSSIQDHKVNRLMLVPPLMVFLAKHPLVDHYDLSHVKDILCGAAPLSREIEEQIMKRLRVKNIRQGYGMTETTLAALMTPPGKTKFGSSGVVVPSTMCKVVDADTGVALGPYREGELCVKGPIVMKGYCGDISATASTIDTNGWLHTGDVCFFDDDGFFFIVDRLKELIKYKGFQVPPAELEAILLTHPDITDAAVIGIPDEGAGELPMAFVVLRKGSSLTGQEVTKFVATQVSPQKRLHGGVKFVNSIPKTGSGKILRRILRDLVKSKL